MQENKEQRKIGAQQAFEEFGLTEDSEFFSDPGNRLRFIESLEFEEMFDISRFINARTRGIQPRELAFTASEGASLPLMVTPEKGEKMPVMRDGYREIKEYLKNSKHDQVEKLKRTSIALEALIIWVHPFADGNGRTSRFWGKFIEDGTTDTQELVAATASKQSRPRLFDERYRIDQGNMVKGQDVLLDEEEIKEYRKTEMPMTEGVSRSLRKLLYSDNTLDRVEKQVAGYTS